VASTACQPPWHSGTSGETLAAVDHGIQCVALLLSLRAGLAQSWCVSLAPACAALQVRMITASWGPT
jgi:hypothetical protein